MTRTAAICALLSFAGPLSAQTEGTLYVTLDRLSYKVEVPPPIAGSGTPMRMDLYHEYSTPLSHFRLISGSPLLDVEQSPPEIEMFKPTEVTPVELLISPKAGADGDTVELPLEVSADEMAPGQTFTMTVPLTPEGVLEVCRELAVPAGEIEVNVRRFANAEYYAWLAVALAVLGILAWRKWRVK